MKIKILIASLVVAILIGVIYYENNNTPSVGFPIIAETIEAPSLPSTSTNTVHSTNDSDSTKNTAKIKLPSFSFDRLNFSKGSNNKLSFESQKISSLTTKNLIIHFWSSWCNVCSTEWPEMIKFADKNPDTTILAISIDDNKSAFSEFMKELNNKYHFDKKLNILFAIDNNKLVSVGVFNTELVPENYFIAREDDQYNIISKSAGKVSWADIK